MITENQPAPASAAAIPETPASAIVADLVATMPTPTAPATPVETVPSSPLSETKAPLRDVNGTAFDPLKHATSPDGSPKTDKLGRYYSNRLGGAKAKAQAFPKQESFIPTETPAHAEAPAPQPSAAAPSSAPASVDRFELLADVYTRATLSGLMAALGDEWSPDDEAEFTALRASVAAYLRATNREDLSPGWALAFAGVTYAGKRMPRPKTQTRIAFFMDKVRAWWRGRSVSRTVNSYPQPGVSS